jgi:hypothetical protein
MGTSNSDADRRVEIEKRRTSVSLESMITKLINSARHGPAGCKEKRLKVGLFLHHFRLLNDHPGLNILHKVERRWQISGIDKDTRCTF